MDDKHSIDVQIEMKDATVQKYSMFLTTQEQAIGFFSPECDMCEVSGPKYDFSKSASYAEGRADAHTTDMLYTQQKTGNNL